MRSQASLGPVIASRIHISVALVTLHLRCRPKRAGPGDREFFGESPNFGGPSCFHPAQRRLCSGQLEPVAGGFLPKIGFGSLRQTASSDDIINNGLKTRTCTSGTFKRRIGCSYAKAPFRRRRPSPSRPSRDPPLDLFLYLPCLSRQSDPMSFGLRTPRLRR